MLLERLHRHLCATASIERERIETDAFLITINRTEPLRFYSYALPLTAEADREAVDRLVAVFREHDRLPRLEWIEEIAPSLAGLLAEAGFEQELRTPLMGCDPGSLREPPRDASEATIAPLADRDVAVRDDLLRAAFGEPARPAGTAPRDPRARGCGVAVAHVDGELAAVATHSPVIEGVSEIMGVATAERFRRRGLAAAVTAAASRAAFAAGAELCVLTPGHEAAQRIYAAAGFEPLATMLHWSLAD
jgi:ribosomal protein S18 acetylase RimI-like enzyme